MKRSHNDAVRELVAFVRKRDKRLAAHQAEEAKRRMEREEEDKLRHERIPSAVTQAYKADTHPVTQHSCFCVLAADSCQLLPIASLFESKASVLRSTCVLSLALLCSSAAACCSAPVMLALRTQSQAKSGVGKGRAVAGGSRRGSSGCRGPWKCKRPTGSSRPTRTLSNSRKRKKSPSLMTSTAHCVTNLSKVKRPLPTTRGVTVPSSLCCLTCLCLPALYPSATGASSNAQPHVRHLQAMLSTFSKGQFTRQSCVAQLEK